MPSGTKLAIYAGSGAGAALLLGAALFSCIRQRRAGRRERDAYNAQVEKDRTDAYEEQMELREKGLGGWDKSEFASQGDDALGGWGGSYVRPGTKAADIPGAAKSPSNVVANEVPLRMNSPAASATSPPARMQTPSLASPVPQSPRLWSGGNAGGMIHNAGNAYSGGYGGSNNIPRSPSFPLSPQVPQQRGYPGGYHSTSGGYQRF